MRVYELAELLGVDDSRKLLIMVSEAGVNVRSASSVLTDEDVAQIRSYWPTPPVKSVLMAGRRSQASLRTVPPGAHVRPRRERWRGPLAPLTHVILERVVMPANRDPYFTHTDPRPWNDEVAEAQRLAGRWASAWFDHTEAEAWIAAHDNRIDPELAARLRAAGLTPEDSALRLWYGKIKPGAPSLAAQVVRGDQTPTEAAEAAKLWRTSSAATPSRRTIHE